MKKHMDDVKIFNVNEFEWYAGGSELQLRAYLKHEFGDDYKDAEIIELTDEDIDTLQFQEDEDDASVITFREQMRKLVEAGTTFPCLFAISEY